MRLALWALACSMAATSALAEPAPTRRDDLVGPPTVAEYDVVLDDAVEAFDKQDYGRARVLFERALALRPNARVLRGLGIASLRLERFTDAKRELTAALADTRQPLTPAQREGVEELLSWMQSHLGTVQLKLTPEKARATLDDAPVSASELMLEAGVYRLRVSSEGFEAQEHSLRILAGEGRTLAIALIPHSIEPRASSAEASAPTKPARASAPEAALPRPITVSTPRERDDGSSSVLEEWWFWTIVGVVAAGGAATALVLTADKPKASYEKGGLGGIIMPLGWTL